MHLFFLTAADLCDSEKKKEGIVIVLQTALTNDGIIRTKPLQLALVNDYNIEITLFWVFNKIQIE